MMLKNLLDFTENRKPKTENPLFRKSIGGLLSALLFLAFSAPVFMGCSTSWEKMKDLGGISQ